MPSPLVPDKIEDELEMTMVCHRPEGLEQLEAQTNFTKRELQVLYRGFKNVRPHGPQRPSRPSLEQGLPVPWGPSGSFPISVLRGRRSALKRGHESKTTWLERKTPGEDEGLA